METISDNGSVSVTNTYDPIGYDTKGGFNGGGITESSTWLRAFFVFSRAKKKRHGTFECRQIS